MTLLDRVRVALRTHTNELFQERSGIRGTISPTEAIYKSVVPNFLYSTAYGFPVNKNIPEIRRLAKTPYVEAIIRTITAEISGMDWHIVPRKGKDIPDEVLEKTDAFFNNPNSNDESLNYVLKQYTRDLLELDAGVIEKIRNLKGELLEFYIRDGGTFTKNPNIHGVLPHEDDFVRPAFYQFGWVTGARIIPFFRSEIAYTTSNPRTESIYGLSAVEVLLDVIQLLTYGIDSNLDYFEDNSIPKGVMKMIGASEKDIKAFGKMFQEQLKKKDPSGKWRRYFHKMPVMNTEGNFERISFSNLELDLIEQQKWFTKLVWSCFGITPTELGFTEDVNKSTAFTESAVFKRKAIKPLVSLIEYHFTRELVDELPWIKGTPYEGNVMFEFDKFDLQEELALRELIWGDIKNGYRSVNEIRIENNMEPKDGGDDLRNNSDKFDDAEKQKLLAEDFGSKPKEEKGFKSFTFDDSIVPEKKNLILNPNNQHTIDILSEKKIIYMMGKHIEQQEAELLTLIRKEFGSDVLSQFKALDLSFTKKAMDLINLGGLKELMAEIVRQSYFKATEEVGVKFNRNFIPNQKAVEFFQTHSFDNMKDVETDMKDTLRAELQRGLINRDDLKGLTDRVERVMKDGRNRAAAVARTETNTAENFGELDAHRQSGKNVLKEWVNSSPEHKHCVELVKKGRIPINEKFVTKDGKEFDAPSAHTNCKSKLKYTIIPGRFSGN